MTPRVKICGIGRVEDGVLAAGLGAFAIGFVFWPRSPRFVEPDRAREIAAALPPGVTTVGVFVDQSPDDVQAIADRVGLGAVQLHGAESVAAFAGIGRPLIKAVGMTGATGAAGIDSLPEGVTVLLDAHDPVLKGGTGRTIDWTRAAEIARRRPTILSGGLHAANVGAAIERVRPYAIDVSSGVESSPGVKDHAKLREFFAAVHASLKVFP